MWPNTVKAYALHPLNWCFAEGGWYNLDAPPARDLSAPGSAADRLKVSTDLMKLVVFLVGEIFTD